MPINLEAIKALPRRTWLIILLIGITVVWYVKTRRGGSFITDGGSAEDSAGSVDTGGVAGVGVGGSGMWTQVDPPDSPGPTPIEDNNAWGRLAIDTLTKSGYNGVLADEAIRRYLTGSTLTPAQGVMVGIAIRDIGAPPEVLVAGPVVPVLPGVTNPSTAGTSKPAQGSTPKPPTGVKVSVLGINSVRLTWTPVVGAVKYRIYKGSNLVATSSDTTHLVSDLKSGSRYTVYVKSVNANGIMSANSAPVTFITKKK